jgi:hypothetical protein
MGNKAIVSNLSLYGTVQHPIAGEVTAYMKPSEPGKFVMLKASPFSREQLQLFRRVGASKNPNLVLCYGAAEIEGNNGSGLGG